VRHLLALLVLLLFAACAAPPRHAPLTVFAAASLTEVLPQVADAWVEAGGGPVTFSFDASSRLAPQIEQGAPADLFISADGEWMDYLEERGLLLDGSRRDLLGNRLVVAVPEPAAFHPTAPAELVSDQLRYLALAGATVPAGKYAEAALRHAGVWEALEPKVVRGQNVRAALTYVTAGEAEAAVVYRTDVPTPGVQVAFPFPEESHPPIRYPVAILRATRARAHAEEFLAFLQGPEASAIFRDAGFEVLSGAGGTGLRPASP